MRFGLALPSYSFADLDYPKAARLRDFATEAEARGYESLWVGLQGQYFVKQLSTQAELVGLQFNRISTMNRYLYGAAFNMGYVPVYGKFAWFNRSIVHWEIWASAGVGPTFTEVISRNPRRSASLTRSFRLASRPRRNRSSSAATSS